MSSTTESLELTVRLFAGAAEVAGHRTLVVATVPGADLAQVISALLGSQPQLARFASVSRWAVGNEFVGDDFKFTTNTLELAMIPPVSGG